MPIFAPSSAAEDFSRLFQADENNPARVLSNGSSIIASYSLRASLPETKETESARSPTGTLVVEWRPVSLSPDNSNTDEALSFGPLALNEPAKSIFLGPTCLVERAPFSVEELSISPNQRVGEPITVSCSVTNRTHLHQTVEASIDMENLHSDVIVSGMGGGSLSFSPGCCEVFRFTLIARRAGEVVLPRVQITSARYGCKVFDNDYKERRLFIAP